MELLKGIWQKLHNTWQSMEKKTKIIIAVVGTTLLVALVMLIAITGRISYAPLYTGLNQQDAHLIVEELEKMGVPYRLEANGRNIMVPRDEVHRLRLRMAGEGIPKGGNVGFEIFDTTRLGTTEFERQINFYRALAGELSRTIMEISAVETARVQLTVPRQKLFAQEDEPAEASVLLKLHPGHSLKQGQIQAIAHLVAGSVDSLDAEHVTIIDTNGNLLSNFMQGGLNSSSLSHGTTLKNMEMQRAFEQQLQKDLEQMLMPVLGYNNYVVKINALLDFNIREETQKIYTPVAGDKGVVRSQQILEESSSGQQSLPGGSPGTDSNIPRYEGESSTSDSEHELFESITNYEINEKIISQVYAPGTVERLSVGVIINRPMETEEIAKVKEVVAAAIGYNENRGDILHIAQLGFDDSLQKEMEVIAKNQEKRAQRNFFLTIGIILVASFLSFYLIRSLVKGLSTKPKKSDVLSMKGHLEEKKARELTPEEQATQEMWREVNNLIDDSPKEAANLLKVWLIEE